MVKGGVTKGEAICFENLKSYFKNDLSKFEDLMKAFYCYTEGIFNLFELEDLCKGLFENERDPIFEQFKTLVGLRDNSRRQISLLCKPFSDYEASRFKRLSWSYYEMPPELPRPLCLGRSHPEYKAIC
jgi:hypothetical protein